MNSPTQTLASGTAGGPDCRPPSEESERIPKRPVRVTGEKAREKKLQEDELVHIISPQLVQCKRCSTEIKLSKKSQFDTFHWYQHRERCLKKPAPEVQKALSSPSWPVASKVHAKRRDIPRSITPPPSITDSSASSSTQSPMPPSPTYTRASPHMSATWELSNQAFQRIQRWTLRDLDDSFVYPPSLGEPYSEGGCYPPPHALHHVKFQESQVRGTYD